MSHIACQYFLNHDLREEELRQQAGLLCAAGYEVVYLHARAGLMTPYLSKNWFSALAVVIDELRRHGVKFAIWDEDNYPSGTAGNRIVNNFPELSSQQLEFSIFEVSEAGKVTLDFPAKAALLRCFAVLDNSIVDLTEYCGTLHTEWGPERLTCSAYSPTAKIAAPHRRRSMNASTFALQWQAPSACRIVAVQIRRGDGRHNTDLLNPRTTEELLACTHKAYQENFGEDLLREQCSASFLDEPAPAGEFPWTGSFATAFAADHGYELLPLLPHLLLDLDEQSNRIRHHYRMTQHRLICENYLVQLQHWLHRYGILSAGHLTRSEWLAYSGHCWPVELRCFKYLDIPCCDPLGAVVSYLDAAAYHLGIKMVSSAARLFDKKFAGSDVLAVGGDEMSLADLKFQLDYQLVLGLNYFNIHGLYYSLEGPRRDEAPPSLFYQHSEWPLMPELLSYLKHRCETLSTGEHYCQIELLYPAAAFHCHRIGTQTALELELHRTAETLLANQRDFELIDEVTLSEQSTENFVRKRPYFLLAGAELITAATATFLEAYVAAGGRLFSIGETLPRLLDDRMREWSFAKQFRCDDWLDLLPAAPLEGMGKENILIRRLSHQGKVISFLFNRAEQAFRGRYDGKDIELAPRASGFATELLSKPEENHLKILAENWRVFPGSNSVPLNFWEGYGFTFDMLSNTLTGEFQEEPLKSNCRFLCSGEISAELIIEEMDLKNAVFFINGHALTEFHPADFRDCREISIDISSFLRSASVPTLNQLEITGKLPENPPYLRGKFKAEYRYGHAALPYLTTAREEFQVSELRDWRDWGYGTFSGCFQYVCDLCIEKTGQYLLDCGQVANSVQILLNGEIVATRIAAPYSVHVELIKGKYLLELRVYNASGNRDRLSGRPAGLFGPVIICKM